MATVRSSDLGWPPGHDTGLNAPASSVGARRLPWASFVAVTVVYVAAARVGLHFAFVHTSATAIWPPTGIALAALLLAGPRLWPAIFLGAFVVNVATTGSVVASLGIAAGNTLEAVVGRSLVERFAGGRQALTLARTMFRFAVLAGLVATAISATIGVASLALTGQASWSAGPSIWLTWWLGDAAGALVVAPLLILWANEPRIEQLRGRLLEATGLAVVTIVVGTIVFGGGVTLSARDAPLVFACVPMLVWAAYRFGPRGAASVIALLSVIATIGTLRGHGPFAMGDANVSLLLLQAFMGTMSASMLPLAALSERLARAAVDSDRLFHQSEARRHAAELFAGTSRLLAQSLDVREVASRIVTSVRELLGGTTAIVYRLDPATGEHVALGVAGDTGPDFTGAFTIPPGVGTIGLAVREQRPVVTADVTRDPRIVLTPDVRDRLTRAPHRAVLAVPLVVHDQTIGAFLVGDRAGRTFSPEEIVLAQAFAHHAALAIANAQLYEDARRREQELSDFFENATVALHWVGPDGVILRANHAELELLGYSRDDYVGRHITEFHLDRDAIDDILRRLAAGETIRSYPARLRTRDGAIRDVIIDSSVYRENGRFVHTRCFTRDVTALRRAEEELVRLLAAERAARADAEAARVHAEEAERRMAILGEIARSITSSLDLDTLLPRIAHGAKELCGSDTAALFLRDESSAMVPRYRVGPWLAVYDRLRIEPGRGIGGQVIASGRPLRSDDYMTDPRVPQSFHAVARETGTVTLLVVPIVIHDRVEGLLYLSNRTARVFTGQDEAICMRLAEQAATAIHHARLFCEARTARAEAEAASRAKDEFLAVLSHELRTPLNAIVGWARMLRSSRLAPDKVTQAVDAIDRNAAAQVQLIEDLLDISRIVSGRLRVDVRPVKLAPVLAAAVDAVRPTAQRKGIAIVTAGPDVPDVVNADPGRLQQVVWNLLSNAVKFTPAGGNVTLTAEVHGDGVRISVSDTGIGIEPAALPHVFDRFHQADSSTTRQHGGLGLGLALVKHLVELHGGTVSAQSNGRDQGATFTITLPGALAAGAPDASLPARASGPAELHGATILVVDDEADARELSANVLSHYGAVVETAASVAHALERLDALKPDVVIADLGMPGEDGFSLIRRLRARESGRGRRTIVVAVTAYVSVQDRDQVLAAGFDAHVGKPFDPHELVMTIRGLLAPSSSDPGRYSIPSSEA
jgi:PAS domain S-box-containing protein